MYQKHLSLLQTMQPVMKYLALNDAFNRLGTDVINVVDCRDDLKIKFEITTNLNEKTGNLDRVLSIDIYTRAKYIGEIFLVGDIPDLTTDVVFIMNDSTLTTNSETVSFRWFDNFDNTTVFELPLQEDKHFQISTVRDIPDMDLIQKFVDYKAPDGINVVAASLHYDYTKHSDNFLEQIMNLMNNGGYAKLYSHIFRGDKR